MKTITLKVDRYEFIVNATPDSEGKRYTCHIPAYDLVFGAKDDDAIEKKALVMVKAFLNFYNIR